MQRCHAPRPGIDDGPREPDLDEVVEEPIIRLMMAADRIDRDALADLVSAARRRLRRTEA